MNWGRGLWRLWLVVAIPWILVFGYLKLDTIRAGYDDMRSAEVTPVDDAACAKPATVEQTAICDLQRKLNKQAEITRGRARADLMASAQWVLLPPLALAFVMIALAWVIRGFRPR